MNKDIHFCLTLKCEHCGNPTVFCQNLSETESQCAYGECGQISKLHEADKQLAYISFLETGYLSASRNSAALQKQLAAKKQEHHLVKTLDEGWRLVDNNQSSIQWAVAKIF